MRKTRMGRLWDLFYQFLKYGLFTFGSGWSIVAQIQKTYVEERGELKDEDILDITSVGRSLPGTMIGNVAVMFGYHMEGVAGGIVCLVGMILPPLVVVSAVTVCYSAFRSNPYVLSAMTGVRAAVVPIIFCAVVRMVKGAYRFPPCYLVTALTFALYYFLDVSCVALVVLGIAAGLLISGFYERKEASA